MSVEAVEAERLRRLGQFIRLDVAVSALATAFVVVIYLFFERNPWLLVATAMAAGAALVMAIGLRPLAEGRPVAALWWVTAGNWSIAIGASLVATFAWPIQIVAAVLPVVVAVPFVRGRAFQLMVLGAVIVCTATAVLGTLQDVTGLTADVPTWSTNLVLIVFMPFMAVLITQAAAWNAETLHDSLDQALEANRSLQANESLLAEQATLLRESRTRIVAAADQERRRIERDLHDGAQQRLVGLSLQISLAREQVGTDPEAARVTLDRIRSEVRGAQDDMRSLVRGLYPPVLTQHGLGPAVRSMVASLPNPIRLDLDAAPRLAPDREASLYFCCREALQNVMKHAPPSTPVSIEITADDEDLIMVVGDDGPGFDPAVDGDGAGLVNMVDRIGAAGGTIDIRSAPGSGTVIEARMPVDAA